MADPPTHPTSPLTQPSPDLAAFERLIGTWAVHGGATGHVTDRCMEGHFFLLQDVTRGQQGQPVRGLEVVGHLHPFGEAVSPEIHSRFSDSQGNTLDYLNGSSGDPLTVWEARKARRPTPRASSATMTGP